jgi:sulfite exporter TauE/SafE/copper chaperone CopZ
MDNEYKVQVAGMTCHSCEVLVERSWKNLPGVKDVKADSGKGSVSITAEREIPQDQLQKSLLDQKYKVGSQSSDIQEKRARPSWSELAGLFALAIGLAWIMTRLGGLVSGGPVNQSVGLGTALFLGVLASVSSCLAVVSGLLISSTASVAQSSDRAGSRAIPVLMFLTGRVMSYTLLGGFLGWLGARLAFSSSVTSLILAAAALYMILVGLDMLHLLPDSVRRYLPGTPKALTHGMLDKAQKTGIWLPSMMGAATFFLPCGFTQALQAYALTTGSFMTSAVILGAFALGTVPGLLIFGLAATSFKGSTGKFMLKVAGALVIVLGILNLSNGIALAGFDPSAVWRKATPAVAAKIDEAKQEQVINMIVTDDGYTPDNLTVRRAVPVRWEIDNRARGCASSLVASSLGINTVLKPGMNVLRFTPGQSGRLAFSCSMGMYRGTISVVDDQTAQTSDETTFMREPKTGN